MAGRGEVVIKIRVDDTNVAAALQKVATQIQQLGPGAAAATGAAAGGFNNIIGAAGLTGLAIVGVQKVFDGLTRIASGTAEKLKEVAVNSVMVADEFEKIGIRYETLLRSQPAAEEAMRWIKDFAKDTPYQVQDISRAGVILTSFGLDFKKNMSIIGDSASMMGVNIEHAAALFGRFSMGMYSQRFLVQLGLSRQKLQEWGLQFGKNGELIEDASVAFEKFKAGLEKERGGLMLRTMETIEGKISNIHDFIDLIKSQIGEGITPIIKFALDLVQDILGQIRDSGMLKDSVAELGEAFMENRDILENIADALPGMIHLVADGVMYAADMVRYFADFYREVDQGGTLVSLLEKTLKGVLVVAIALLENFKDVAQIIGDIVDISANWDPLSGKFAGKEMMTLFEHMNAGAGKNYLEIAEGRIAGMDSDLAARRGRRENKETWEKRADTFSARLLAGTATAREIEAAKKATGYDEDQLRAEAQARVGKRSTYGMGAVAEEMGGGGEGGGGGKGKLPTVEERLRMKGYAVGEWEPAEEDFSGAFGPGGKGAAEFKATTGLEKRIKEKGIADEFKKALKPAISQTITESVMAGFEKANIKEWAMGRFKSGIAGGLEAAFEQLMASKVMETFLNLITGGSSSGVSGILRGFMGGFFGGKAQKGALVPASPSAQGVPVFVGDRVNEGIIPFTPAGLTTMLQGVRSVFGDSAVAGGGGGDKIILNVSSIDPWHVGLDVKREVGAAARAEREW